MPKKNEDIPWQDFDKLLVIKRLRALLEKWWRVQVNFTDAQGYLRGVPKGKFFRPINPVCQAITKDPQGFKGCLHSVRSKVKNIAQNKKSELASCHSGFSTLSVPILCGTKFLGLVFVDGFLLEDQVEKQKKEIRNYLRLSLKSTKKINDHVDHLPVLNKQDLKYMTELVKVVVDEIVIVYKNLAETKQTVSKLEEALGERYSFEEMIGKSKKMQAVYSLLERVADSKSLVLIQGENGTGKELVARALHYSSKRSKKTFISVNCGAFNESLLESELFGYVKGAFTGALGKKKGLFEAADAGTLFLDEIGETSQAMQVKLLRVLQDGSYLPVGDTEPKKTTARVVCATNRNLEEMIEKGEFRKDLFYRLNVINIMLPSLKERKEDLPLLIDYFLEEYAKENKMKIKRLSQECMKFFINYDWPGNIRELRNEIERLYVLSYESATSLQAEDLSERILRKTPATKEPTLSLEKKLSEVLNEAELSLIRRHLEEKPKEYKLIAKKLGITQLELKKKIKKHQIAS